MTHMSETEKWMKGAYAQFRLDGCTHDEAMVRIKAAMDAAIPKAVKTFMSEIAPKQPLPMCAACNGFGYDGPSKCSKCNGAGRVTRSKQEASNG